MNCRQIGARARRRVESERPRFDTPGQARDDLAARFFTAVIDGDMERLVELLAADVAVYGDGGGKAPQWAAAIVGADRVARLFAGLSRQIRELGIRLELAGINGQPGAICRDADGNVTNVFALDILDGVVVTIRSVINPDKLAHLGPVADVRALARRAAEETRSPTSSRAADEPRPR